MMKAFHSVLMGVVLLTAGAASPRCVVMSPARLQKIKERGFVLGKTCNAGSSTIPSAGTAATTTGTSSDSSSTVPSAGTAATTTGTSSDSSSTAPPTHPPTSST